MVEIKSEQCSGATQCCGAIENALLCREGCACCPGGSWTGSVGDGRTFACNGEMLVQGVDEFAAECVSGQGETGVRVMCESASECDGVGGFVCRVDPECTGSTIECLGAKVCLSVDGVCESALDCAAGFECMARNARSKYCVQYQ